MGGALTMGMKSIVSAASYTDRSRSTAKFCLKLFRGISAGAASGRVWASNPGRAGSFRASASCRHGPCQRQRREGKPLASPSNELHSDQSAAHLWKEGLSNQYSREIESGLTPGQCLWAHTGCRCSALKRGMLMGRCTATPAGRAGRQQHFEIRRQVVRRNDVLGFRSVASHRRGSSTRPYNSGRRTLNLPCLEVAR